MLLPIGIRSYWCWNKMRLFPAIILLLVGCAVKKLPDTDTNNSEHALKTSNNEILFLNFEFFNRNNLPDSITLLNSNKVQGKSNDKSVSSSYLPGDLKLSIYNKDELVLTELRIGDPLRKQVESFNPDGTIESVKIELEKAQFFIRINYNPAFDRVFIYKTEENGKFTELFNMKLEL